MNEAEEFELAAKAAGIIVERSRLNDPACRDMLVKDSVRNPFQGFGPWNPRTDDGDCMRLANKLGICLDYAGGYVAAYAGSRMAKQFTERQGDDPDRTTREAVFRAAVEIGRAMP